MKRILQLLIIFIIISGCKPKVGNISANADKGIKEIISFYGGKCEYGFKKTISIGSKNTNTFWLKLSHSSTADSLADIIELPASNMVFLFYRNLGKDEIQYDQIEATVITSDGQSKTFNYSVEILKTVKNKFPVVEKTVAMLRDKKFEEIAGYIRADSTSSFNKDTFISGLVDAENKLGKIKGVLPMGFKFYTAEKEMGRLYLAGLVLRDNQNTQFSIAIDPESTDNELFQLIYSYK